MNGPNHVNSGQSRKSNDDSRKQPRKDGSISHGAGKKVIRLVSRDTGSRGQAGESRLHEVFCKRLEILRKLGCDVRALERALKDGDFEGFKSMSRALMRRVRDRNLNVSSQSVQNVRGKRDQADTMQEPDVVVYEYECPECNATVADEDVKCSGCGVLFE